MDIRKILLPVDGSPIALKATQEAADFAKAFNAEVLLLHCNEIFPNLKQQREYVQDVARHANAVLGPSRDILQDNEISYLERVLDGSASEEISAVAEKEHVDVIVMGSRGTNPLEGLFLGSVTHRVLKTAPCRVLVVR